MFLICFGSWKNPNELFGQPYINKKGFPQSSVGKEFACNAGDPGSIPGLGRSAGEGIGYPFQYSGLENFMDCVIHGVAESDTTERLSHINKNDNVHHLILLECFHYSCKTLKYLE